MKKLFDDKLLLFLLIFLYGSIITIFMYYPTFNMDGYCQLSGSYTSYASNFLAAGRFLTTFFWMFFDFIQLPNDILSILSHTLSIVFLSWATVEIIFCLKKYINQSLLTRIILLLGSILLFFNPFTHELFIFEESFCMSLSVFLSVYAAICITEEIDTRSFLKSLFMLICASFLYQGTISYFIPLVILINVFQNKKGSLIRYIKDNYRKIIVYVVLYGACCIVQFISLQLYVNIANVESAKVGTVSIFKNITIIFKLFIDVWRNMFGMIRPYIFKLTYLIALVAIVLRCLIDFKDKGKYIVYTLIISFLALFASFIPNLVMASDTNYTASRLLLSYGAEIGIIAICSLLIFDRFETNLNNYFYSLIICIISLFFIYNSGTTFYNSYKDYQRYKNDIKYFEELKETITSYEKDNNVKIKNLYFSRKNVYPEFYEGRLNNLNNYRACSSGWGFICGVKGLVNNQYSVKEMDELQYEKMIKDNTFVLVEDNSIYIILK